MSSNAIVVSLLILQAFCSKSSLGQHVYIEGQWENGPDSVSLYYFEDATTGKSGMLRSGISPGSNTFKFQVEVHYSTILDLADQLFIVLPGDSVKVSVVEIAGRSRLNFAGSRMLRHSFLSRFVDEIGWFPAWNYSIDESTIATYKTNATNHFDSCVAFLEGYFTVGSDPFKIVARDFLTLRYYENLIYPLISGKVSKERLPSGYFDLVDFSLFRRAELLGFRQYIILISYFNKYFYSLGSLDGNVYDSALISADVESATRNFEGEIKDHLLLFIFFGVSQNGTGQNKSQVDRLYQYLRESFSDEARRVMQIDSFKRDFDTIDRLLPEEILAQQMITQNGKHVSLNEVFASNDVVYLDFWASWCGPCLIEMPYENQLISEFKGKQIKFVLISIDEDEKEWREAIAKINVKGSHYLIADGVKSPLTKYLSIQWIPRYIIFDKKGRLISRDAPRPRAILKDRSILSKLLN